MKRFEPLLPDFGQVLNRLKESVALAKSELEMDGVIQRFEWTLEFSWKAMKRFLEQQGMICNSLRGCLKEAFPLQLIQHETAGLQMLADRNASTHLDNPEASREIFGRIRSAFVPELQGVFTRMSEGN